MKNLTVHKEGEEGTILLDAATGKIITLVDDRPDWAEGLTTGLVQERLSFYEKRLGAGSSAFKALLADAIAVEFSDMGWIGVDASGDEQEVYADHAFRSEVIAKALGVDTDTGEMKGPTLAEREVSRENRGRTQTEIEALEDSVAQGFSGETARQQVERERQTGTR